MRATSNALSAFRGSEDQLSNLEKKKIEDIAQQAVISSLAEIEILKEHQVTNASNLVKMNHPLSKI